MTGVSSAWGWGSSPALPPARPSHWPTAPSQRRAATRDHAESKTKNSKRETAATAEWCRGSRGSRPGRIVHLQCRRAPAARIVCSLFRRWRARHQRKIRTDRRSNAENGETNGHAQVAWPRWLCPDPAVAADDRTRHLRDGRSSRRRNARQTKKMGVTSLASWRWK